MGSRAPTILHVDDNEVHRYTVAKILKMAGYRVAQAATGSSGLELARERPNLIILDVNLPDMSGFDVCKSLRSDPQTSSIPILHVSATRILTRDKTEGLEGGADAYLAEPVDSGEFLATVRALLRMRESEERASRLATEWETTFDAMNDGVCLTDTEGKITRCNRAISLWLGKTKVDLVGERFVDVFPQGSFAEGSNEGRPTREVSLGGRCCRITTDSIRGEDGNQSGQVHTFVDITAMKAAERDRKRYTEELARSNAELYQFAHVASHDLKEPLRMVASNVQLLQRRYAKALDEKAQEYVTSAVEGAERMRTLIDDLLAYSTVGSQGAATMPTDLNEVLRQVRANLDTAMQETRGKLTVAELPIVRVEPIQYLQLFQNLVGNALKFRGDEAPSIFVRASREKNAWRFEVADNGIGIDPRYQDRIFELFKRLHTKDRYAGTGIGLSICKKIVERHGGKIWVESELGHGARFFWTLPD
jgi:signal transduction histidine kinase/DNA-binding response OmpR family regulator